MGNEANMTRCSSFRCKNMVERTGDVTKPPFCPDCRAGNAPQEHNVSGNE